MSTIYLSGCSFSQSTSARAVTVQSYICHEPWFKTNPAHEISFSTPPYEIFLWGEVICNSER